MTGTVESDSENEEDEEQEDDGEVQDPLHLDRLALQKEKQILALTSKMLENQVTTPHLFAVVLLSCLLTLTLTILSSSLPSYHPFTHL